ncbi:MAG TPA: polyprenol monophosphomannose synthase [Candidatus Wunengus sp. YC61]|uniref:polyprenol monophosphomannose synthase n=1 Tax=Candidatus Wunengus sp. YC61 TaxID=3367698 RepID=UPI0040281A2C
MTKTSNTHTISIIVPTYNEKETIISFLEKTTCQITNNNLNAEIIVVDDGSPDGTAELISDFSKEHTNITLLNRQGKLGLASACIYGFRHTDSPIIGVMDSDFSHAPNALPYLLNPLLYNLCDITVGSRYISGGRILNWPLRRHITSRTACYLGSLLTTIKDVTSGFFFLKREVIREKDLDPVGFKICLEILVKGDYQTILEVPYTFSDRVTGKSKMGTKEMLLYLQHLYKLYKYKKTNKKVIKV